MSIQQLALLLLILLVGLACVFKAQKIQSFFTAASWTVESKAIAERTTIIDASVVSPSNATARGNNTKTIHHAQSSNHDKYLQFFVSGGWSNQLACLASAYSIAWATNRTLILSPVVPQGQLHFRTVFDTDRTLTFRLDVDLRYLYQGFHLRLDQVLDVQALNPYVPSIHFADFYQQIYPTLRNPQTWVMETNYSHLNSQWIFRQPELVGQFRDIEAREYNIDFQYTIESRDLETIAKNFYHYDIWTLLDAFQAIKHNQLPITFQPRFSSWIRHTAHQLIEDTFAADTDDVGATIPIYAAVHIRGSDGPFKNPATIEGAITQTLDRITKSIVQSMTSTASSTNYQHLPPNITTIGLFVATDIQQTLQSNPIFLQKIEMLQQLLQDQSTILKVVFGTDLTKNLQQLYQTTNQSSSFPFPDWKAPTIFLDQQMAACATIDFQGTHRSTFSNFIQRLRVNQSYSCSK